MANPAAPTLPNRPASPLANRSAAPTNRYAPPRAAVRDYARPSAEDELADRGTRLAAALLEGIVFAAMVYLPLLLLIPAGISESSLFGVLAVVGALIGFVVWVWLTIKFINENGQSIAKRMLHIKVVRSDGSPVSFGRILLMRNLLNALISIIPLYGLIEVLFIFSESRQCLHDKLADTIVVKA
jgi:uncharacterized RDD family membrane protein YckC